MIVRAVLAALIASIGFYLMAAHFHCCQGESGFDINVAYAIWVAVALAVASGLVQIGRVGRLLSAMTWALPLFIALGAIVLLARPPWDDYVFARPLQLGVRTAGVFAAAVSITWLQFRWRARRAAARP